MIHFSWTKHGPYKRAPLYNKLNVQKTLLWWLVHFCFHGHQVPSLQNQNVKDLVRVTWKLMISLESVNVGVARLIGKTGFPSLSSSDFLRTWQKWKIVVLMHILWDVNNTADPTPWPYIQDFLLSKFDKQNPTLNPGGPYIRAPWNLQAGSMCIWLLKLGIKSIIKYHTYLEIYLLIKN